MSNGNENGREPIPRVVTIPEGYEDDFVQLRALGDASVEELLSVLKDEPPALSHYELTERIYPKVISIPRDDLVRIMRILFTLYSLRARASLSAPDFARDILRAMDETGFAGLELSGQDRESFEDRLIQLLGADNIEIGLKANELLIDHEHTIHSARVLTDIRPVFGDDPENGPKAAVIVHMLKISYHDESNEVKEFYVALDTGDVDRLVDTLERADAKAKGLSETLRDTSITYIHAD